jgi:hypothetical protein
VTDASPIEHPAVEIARLRRKVESAVDQLLSILDTLGGDPDLEPSLGFLEPAGNRFASGHGDQTRISEGAADDREEQCEDEGTWIDEKEASLGRTDAIDQTRHQLGQDDLEPTMGASASTDQRQWASGYDDKDSEREDVSEDEGGACEDEGAQDEREPETGDCCNWGDDLEDQRELKLRSVYRKRVPTQRPFREHANVGSFLPVPIGRSGSPIIQIIGPPLLSWNPVTRTWEKP